MGEADTFMLRYPQPSIIGTTPLHGVTDAREFPLVDGRSVRVIGEGGCNTAHGF